MKNLQLELRPPSETRALAVTSSNSISVPAYQIDDAADAVVTACRRAVAFRPDDGSAPESHRLPLPAERHMLETRRAHLAVIARGCGATDAEKRKAAAAISEMLDGFTRSRNLDAHAKRNMIAGFVNDLQALPAWAIARACERLRRGEIEDQSLEFAPTTARVYQVALGEMAGLRVEERAINETLRLQPVRDISTVTKAGAEAAQAWLKREDRRVRRLLGIEKDEAEQHDSHVRLRHAVLAHEAFAAHAWGSDTPPRIGGIPVSPELAAQLRIVTAEASA